MSRNWKNGGGIGRTSTKEVCQLPGQKGFMGFGYG